VKQKVSFFTKKAFETRFFANGRNESGSLFAENLLTLQLNFFLHKAVDDGK